MDEELNDGEARLISAGKYVVIQKVGGEHIRVMQLNSHTRVVIEKLKIDAKSAFGKPYGLFEVNGMKVSAVPTSKQFEDKQPPKREMELPKLVSGDSESVDEVATAATEQTASSSEQRTGIGAAAVDGGENGSAQRGRNQAVTHQEIMALKQAGASADSLVAKLVQGNETFSQRTSFSKEKYIDRKQKKHSLHIWLLKPTIRLIGQAYYLREPERIGSLRGDQLSLLLQYASVHSGRKILVFEQVLGLVTSGIVSRLGGQGACVHIHRGSTPQSIPALHVMNYNDQMLSTFMPVRIQSALQGESLPWSDQPSAASSNRAPKKDGSGSFTMDEANGDGEPNKKRAKLERDSTEITIEDEEMNDPDREDTKQKQVLRTAREEMGIAVMKEGVDSLVFATRTVHPLNLLEKFYSCLKMSGTISIYSPQMEPLLDCYAWLQKNQTVVQMHISDQMCRILQVLPDRTHPLMSQQVGGGYILNAIKVNNAKPIV